MQPTTIRCVHPLGYCYVQSHRMSNRIKKRRSKIDRCTRCDYVTLLLMNTMDSVLWINFNRTFVTSNNLTFCVFLSFVFFRVASSFSMGDYTFRPHSIDLMYISFIGIGFIYLSLDVHMGKELKRKKIANTILIQTCTRM